MSDGFSFKDLHKNATVVLEGEFPVVIEEVVHDKPSQNGKPMLRCKVKISSGPYAGRVIRHNFTLSLESQTAMQIFFRDMATLGADEKFFQTDPTMASVAAQITGRHAIATLKKGTWGDTPREEIGGWKKSTGIQVTSAGSPSGLPAAASLPKAEPVAAVVVAADTTVPPADPF